ncbi:2-C-methyl-D-erythritol 4-phosphate cytidylyltransferase [Endozoicomonas sp. Mp262]|uniref:2-C-methyl-D-erythritol 4-phosphate cytidylyltransferase n=1 Tax=Endozoicomonas sp. Mp262 TaxID=2919499 RepID=UPI0021D8E1A6
MAVSDQPMAPKFWAIIPAAGVGRRMNVDIPKQYLEIRGKTLIEHTLERLIDFPTLEKIVVVLGAGDEYARDIDLLDHQKILLAEGGKERSHSVMNGMEALKSHALPEDWVLVHDAARPCIRRADLDWLVECLKDHEVGGLLGTPVRDTMKRTGPDDSVIETVERCSLWHAFTPQMFRFAILEKALATAVRNQVPITDEASAIEYAGFKPMMVEGHTDNIKVTSGPDLALASLHIEQQSKLIESL